MDNNKGITLAALIVTIVVMLVLVGVTVSTLNNSGLIGKSSEAAMKTEMKALEEKIIASYEFDNYGLIAVSGTKANIENALSGYQHTITDANGQLPITIQIQGNYGKNYEIVVNYTGLTSRIIGGEIASENIRRY